MAAGRETMRLDWDHCREFLASQNGTIIASGVKVEDLLPYMTTLDSDAKDTLRRPLLTEKTKLSGLLEIVHRSREPLIFEQLLKHMCKEIPHLQTKWLQDPVYQKHIGFVYSSAMALDDIPTDNVCFEWLCNEFDHDNPLLPTWQDFARECDVPESKISETEGLSGGRKEKVERIIKYARSRRGSHAKEITIEKLLVKLWKLNLCALHEELVDHFEVTVHTEEHPQALSTEEEEKEEDSNVISMDNEDDDDTLSELARAIASRWEDVAKKLKFPYQERQTILIENRGDIKKQAYEFLVQWVQSVKIPNRPLREHLKYALSESRCNDVVRKFMGQGKVWECGDPVKPPKLS